MFTNVCRLCLGTEELLWIFSEEMADNMKEIIMATSGVEICRNDTVTQMVCSTCCQVTIKMYRFRTKSIKNDKDLKARCAGYNIAQLTQAAAINKIDPVPAAPSTIVRSPLQPPPPIPTPPPPPPPPRPKPLPPYYKFAHPSVKALVRKNPNIKLPVQCLKSHVGAYITLLSDEVDEYFRERKMTDAEIAHVKKRAAEWASTVEDISPITKRCRVERRSSAPGAPRSSTDSNKSKESAGSDTNKAVGNVGEKVVPKAAPEKFLTKVEVPNGIKIKMVGGDGAKRSPSLLGSLLLSPPSQKKKLVPVETVKNCEEKAKTADPAKKEEITLTSILQNQQPLASSGNDIIEVINSDTEGDPPAVLASVTGVTLTVPETEFEFFTSRPFVKDSMKRRPRPLSSDSDNDNDNGAFSDCEQITLDLDSRDSSSNEVPDKTTFTEALRLAPREQTDPNQPDLSLVSLASKSYTLYTCRICDSQHSSLKEMKQHEKRTHTKCPFCRKRFRTLANRDEHIVNACAANTVKLKQPLLQLMKVDEDPEIVKKYASAFGGEQEEDKEEPTVAQTQPEAPPPQQQPPPVRPEVINVEDVEELPAFVVEKPATKPPPPPAAPVAVVAAAAAAGGAKKSPGGKPLKCDSATANAISELEKFLNYAELIPIKGKNRLKTPTPKTPTSQTNSTPTPNTPAPTKTGNDIICISDEEGEVSTSTPPQPQPAAPVRRINVVNSDILRDINIHDTDINVLKRILTKERKRIALSKVQPAWSIEDSPIVDGNTNKVKIFKNLRKCLHHYKIPIEVRYNNTLSVEYKPRTRKPTVGVLNLWTNQKPQELRPTQPEPPTSGNSITILNRQIGLKQISTPLLYQGVVTSQSLNTVQSTANIVIGPATMTTTTTTSPLVLNGATSGTNFILLSNSLLPATQGPLPVIESVTSACDQPSLTTVAQLESITNSLMPNSVNNVPAEQLDSAGNLPVNVVNEQPPMQAAIRVKDLKQLI